MKHDRTMPCHECPFIPGGNIGGVSPDTMLQALQLNLAFSCHLSYGKWQNGKFEYISRCALHMQQCAGYLIFAKNIGINLDPEKMNRTIFGFPRQLLIDEGGSARTLKEQISLASDDRVFKTAQEFTDHHQAAPSPK